MILFPTFLNVTVSEMHLIGLINFSNLKVIISNFHFEMLMNGENVLIKKPCQWLEDFLKKRFFNKNFKNFYFG